MVLIYFLLPVVLKPSLPLLRCGSTTLLTAQELKVCLTAIDLLDGGSKLIRRSTERVKFRGGP
jgi:hypothetical protein